ncbi:MAG: GTPase Era [Acidaminococcaceae bacterium]|nr:GTPase Era [Acidaminococcaceae bacterium]HCJ90438.1 GTPase Era [Acidaminococcaceae bacterium]
MTHHSGFAALVGRPNVGKSTLMNAMVGEKIAIMSDRPQTTRNRILGILSTDDAQIMFLDTPGIHKPLHKLGEYMNRQAGQAMDQVDVILFLVDATEKKGTGEQRILERLRHVKVPVLLVINKIDRLEDKAKLLAIMESYAGELDFGAVIPVSALTREGLDELQAEIVKHLPEGPDLYPEDELTDQPMRAIAKEMIREKVLLHTRDEIPHAIAVEVTEFKDRPNGNVYVGANIYVERESQKGIVIGAKGGLLKQIGKEARLDIEGLTGTDVYLDLWVKVRPGWRNKKKALKEFGYQDDEEG